MPREVIDVDALLARKAEAQATVSEAEAAIEQHHAEVAARREAREREFDAGTVAAFDDQHRALLAQEQAARKVFEQAILTTPVVDAWVQHRALRWSRVALHAEVQGASNRLGRDREYAAMEPREPRLLEEVARVAEDAAKAAGYDRIDALITQPRDAHIAEDQS